MKWNDFVAEVNKVSPEAAAVLHLRVRRYDAVLRADDAYNAVDYSFTWANTPEDWDFWNDVQRQLRR